MRVQSRRKIYYFILLGFGIWVLLLVKPYLGMLFLAFVITVLFDPIFKYLSRKLKHASLASLITTGLVVSCIVIPVIIVISIAANQAIAFANDVQKAVAGGDITPEKIVEILDKLSQRFPDQVNADKILQRVNLERMLTTVASNVANFASNTVLDVLSNSLVMVTDLTIFIMIVAYLFPVKDKWLENFIEFSPLDDEEDKKYIQKLEGMIKTILKGNFLIAIVQGSLGGLMFWIVGIPAPVFWGVMMSVASLIPLGSGIVWTPAGLLLVLTGSLWRGVVLLLWGVLVISTVDNVIRGWILEHDESHLPPLLTLISVLGGLRMFGFMGFLYGPIIMMFFLISLRDYRDKITTAKKSSPDAINDQKENKKVIKE